MLWINGFDIISNLQNDRVKKDRELKIGLIEVACRETRYLYDTFNSSGGKKSYDQANKKDCKNVTKGKLAVLKFI